MLSAHGLIPVYRGVCIPYFKIKREREREEREKREKREREREKRERERERERQHSTIFATFTFLVYVLLTNNLASSIKKYEGSLT